MTQNKPLFFGLLASAIIILFKLFIVLGGFAITTFGFNWSPIVSVFMIIPFIGLTIKSVRTQNGGFIEGRVALKKALQMAVITIIVVSAYNYIEFEWKWRAFSEEYYNSDKYLAFLKRQNGLKAEDYPKIIKEQIEYVKQLSAFRFTTIKIVPYFLFSVSSAFMFAVFMKRTPNHHQN